MKAINRKVRTEERMNRTDWVLATALYVIFLLAAYMVVFVG